MDELVKAFIETYFTDEMKLAIYDSFDTFSKFGLGDVDSNLIDIISDEGYESTENMQDAFLAEINAKLDFILNEHTIKLRSEATIDDRLQILTGLHLVQDLENYTSIITLLESLEDDHYILASILEELTNVDKGHILSVIEFFNPEILIKLKEYIYTKESPETSQCNMTVYETIKQFFKFNNQESLGTILIKARAELGLEFSSYFPLIKEDIISLDNKQTALNFLSVLMISKDGQISPIELYREYSSSVFQDINLISNIEVILIGIYNSFIEYQKVQDEKTRLSKISS